MFMYMCLQVNLVPIPYDSKCVSVSASVSVSVHCVLRQILKPRSGNTVFYDKFRSHDVLRQILKTRSGNTVFYDNSATCSPMTVGSII